VTIDEGEPAVIRIDDGGRPVSILARHQARCVLVSRSKFSSSGAATQPSSGSGVIRRAAPRFMGPQGAGYNGVIIGPEIVVDRQENDASAEAGLTSLRRQLIEVPGPALESPSVEGCRQLVEAVALEEFRW